MGFRNLARRFPLLGRSVSLDLAVCLMLLVLAATSLVTLFVYETRSEQMLAELRAETDEAADNVAQVLSMPMWNLDQTGLAMVGAAFSSNDLVVGLSILDQEGVPLFRTDKALEGHGVIRRTRDVTHNGEVIGRVEMAYSLAGYEASRRDLLDMSLASGFVALFVIGLGTGVLLRTRLRRPLETLRQGARQVADGDYSHPLEELRQRELADIADSFDRMRTEVASREQALQRANADLLRAERKYRGIFNNAEEGIFQTTRDGRVVSANPSMAAMLGYDSPAGLMASVKDVVSQVYVDPEDRRRIGAMVAEQGRVRGEAVRFKRRDGSVVWGLLSVQIVQPEDGKTALYEGVVIDITERKRMEDELRYRALHDPLTGLANRALALDRIQSAQERIRRREDYMFCVLFLDLDRFKIVNDSLGHRFGDMLLVEVGKRLSSCMRELDTVCRFGGDEFLILLEEIESLPRAMRAVKRIRERLRRPYLLAGHEIRVSPSVGMVQGDPAVREAEEMVQRANLAMHCAKEAGRNRFRLFTPRMLDRAELMLTLENDMAPAIARGEFFLEYQPIMRREGGLRLFGFEALVRWRHPRLGVLAPGEFIPMAEETGRINDLGLWVLEEACSTMARWRERGAWARDLVISVNVSARQLSQQDLVARVMDVLERSGLPARRLKLEITETAIMRNSELAIEKLGALRDKGIRISVDDFGTGYSSMGYLQRLPLDSLKIDLSFVRGLEESESNVEIVRAIVNLAHTLGLEVIAEGVELVQHQEKLAALSCEYLQGYLYSRPLPDEHAVGYIDDCLRSDWPDESFPQASVA